MKILISNEDKMKNKYWKYCMTILGVSNLVFSIATFGNIIYAYQYVQDNNYSELIKNITKIIHKACQEFDC